jgi:hypothetical protein
MLLETPVKLLCQHDFGRPEPRLIGIRRKPHLKAFDRLGLDVAFLSLRYRYDDIKSTAGKAVDLLFETRNAPALTSPYLQGFLIKKPFEISI